MYQYCCERDYETNFCKDNNCRKRINCQYHGCDQQNKAQFFCDEPFFKYRFLCKQCSIKFLNLGMVELSSFDNFKNEFLIEHVKNTHSEVIQFQRKLQKQFNEIKELYNSLSAKIDQSLNVRFDNVLKFDAQNNGAELNQLQFMQYLQESINFLSYQNQFFQQFEQATLDFKFIVKNLITRGEQLGFTKTQEQSRALDEYKKISYELFTSTKYEESLQVCNDYLVMKPNEISMQFRAGQCLIKLEKYQEAIKYFEIIEVNNNVQNVGKFDFYLYYGQCLHKMKKYDMALKKYQIALKQNQNNPELQLHVANTLMKLNYLDEAESVFSTLSKGNFQQDRRNEILYYRFQAKLLLQTCNDQEDLDSVVKELEKKNDEDTQNIKIMYTLGLIKQNQLKFNEALRYLNDILIIQPNHQKSSQLILKIQRKKRLLQGNEKKQFNLCECLINCFRKNNFQFIEL